MEEIPRKHKECKTTNDFGVRSTILTRDVFSILKLFVAHLFFTQNAVTRRSPAQ